MLASLKFLKYKNSYISVKTSSISYVIDQSLTIQSLISQKNEQVFLKQGFEPWTACLLFYLICSKKEPLNLQPFEDSL